ncbi:hypothetical protein DYB36_007525, partial [Aphanomyces astaci]
TILGLFGTIDARHIPCLDAMRVFFSKAQQAVDAAVATNDYAQVSFERLQLPWTCPAEWIGVPRFAGNILCDQFLVSYLVAAMAVHSNKLNVTATCGCVPAASDCLGTLIETTRMIETYLFRSDWVLGQREVVSIEGDVGTFVLLWSVSASVTDTLPNPLDVPQNVALYSRAVAGAVYVGSTDRFRHAVAMALGSMTIVTSRSCWLGALKYHFGLDKWPYKNCVYLDQASAVITELLCVKWSGVFYVLDIQLWRTFVLDVPHDKGCRKATRCTTESNLPILLWVHMCKCVD